MQIKFECFKVTQLYKQSKMSAIATLRCPCVHNNNYNAVLRKLAEVVEFAESDVRFNENVQKPNHWVIYVDVRAFKNSKFESDFRGLVLKECLQLGLRRDAYVLVGIGKSQEQCDAEEAEKATQNDACEVIQFGV